MLPLGLKMISDSEPLLKSELSLQIHYPSKTYPTNQLKNNVTLLARTLLNHIDKFSFDIT